MSQLDFIPCFLSHNVEQINLWHIIELAIMNGMRQFIPIGKFHTHQQPSWFSSYVHQTPYQLSANLVSYVGLGIIQPILQMT